MSLVSAERNDDLTWVRLNRPERKNALDLAMVEELHAVLDAADTPGVLIFTSATPGMFVSGADIAELRDRTAVDALRRINGKLFDRIAAYPWPTIAVIDGAAYGGGCEFALACDFRVVSTSARFAQPELSLGIMAAAGGNHRLERLAGLGIARRMLLAGEVLDAEQAIGCGLADLIDDPNHVDETARQLAARVSRASWEALEYTKRALVIREVSTADIDAIGQALLFESDEKQRRMDAFLATRRERREQR